MNPPEWGDEPERAPSLRMELSGCRRLRHLMGYAAFEQPFGDDGRPAVHGMFLVEAPEMGVHRPGGHSEPLRNFFVAQAFGYEGKYLDLPGTEVHLPHSCPSSGLCPERSPDGVPKGTWFLAPWRPTGVAPTLFPFRDDCQDTHLLGGSDVVT